MRYLEKDIETVMLLKYVVNVANNEFILLTLLLFIVCIKSFVLKNIYDNVH